MARDGTYGDHITLQAAADVFNIQIVIYSTLGKMATQRISPMNSSPTATFYLGHFAEGAEEHYVCLADECRDETISVRPNTEHSCLYPAQEEQAQLDSASDINIKEDQFHNNIDQHAPDVSTTHRNRTGLHENEQKYMTTKGSYPQMRRSPPVHNEQSELNSTPGINLLESQSHSNKDPQHVNTTHENEEEDMSNQCAYEKRGKDNASQLNGCNTDYGPYLNPDI